MAKFVALATRLNAWRKTPQAKRDWALAVVFAEAVWQFAKQTGVVH